MKKINCFIMKVKKFFRQDPESLELKQKKERMIRNIELQEAQKMIAEYESMMDEDTHWKVESLHSRIRKRLEEQKRLEKQKELEEQKELEKQKELKEQKEPEEQQNSEK